MSYVLDSNVFMEARKRHYGFDFCPAFWDWLDKENLGGNVFSIEKVLSEINAGDDDLIEWAGHRGPQLFLPPDERMLDSLPAVAQWVRGRAYAPSAMTTFFQDADYYLIAHALAHDDIVVTHEAPAPLSRKTIKIPDVCIGLAIRCINPFEMLREKRARFVLGSIA